jgi:hypothetical protein
VAYPERETYRDTWWEARLKEADTPQKKVTVLQGKILADISKLPERHRDAARELAAHVLEGLVDEIQIKVAEEAWA